MTMPLIQGRNFNQDLYNRSLSAAYRVWTRLYNPDYAESREPDMWAKIRRDATISQAIEQRLNSIAARQWRVEGYSDDDKDQEAAGVVEDILKNIRHFNGARKLLACAVFRARSFAYIEGKNVTLALGEDKEHRNWWVPIRLRDVDPRRVRYRPDYRTDENGDEKLSVFTDLWNVTRNEYLPMENPEYFVKVKYYGDEEGRLNYGHGILESLFFFFWAKGIIWKEGLQGLERWSQGIVIGKVDSFREGSTTKQNETMRDELFTALRDMRSRNILITDKETDIDVKDGGMAGHQMVVTFLKYIDEKILSLVLGSSLPYGGGDSGGSYARAEVEENSSEALIQFDRTKLDEDLTHDLIGQVWRMNRANFAALGLADANMPRFSSVQEKRQDPTVVASIISQMSAVGLPLRKDEVYDRIGFTMPKEDDEIFEPKQAEPPGGGMPGMPFND
jgi:phage gp29-like protein